MSSLLPEVYKLVEADNTSLVLLSHVVGCCSLSTAFRSNHDDVYLVLWLYGRGEFDLELILQELIKFGFLGFCSLLFLGDFFTNFFIGASRFSG